MGSEYYIFYNVLCFFFYYGVQLYYGMFHCISLYCIVSYFIDNKEYKMLIMKNLLHLLF